MPSVPNESRQFFALLLESTQHRNLGKGKATHARIFRSARSSCHHLGNSLVNLYAKCGDLRRARLVFDNLTKKDLVSWNCLINASCASQESSGISPAATAMELLRRMRRENASPSAHTFSAIFTAVETDVLAGRQSHAAAIKMAGFGDVFVGSSLLNLYCKAGFVSDARKVFDEMPERNLVSWASMISGYGRERMETEALLLFKQLRLEKLEFESEFVFTSVLSSLTDPGLLISGRQIHCLVEKNGLLPFVPVKNSLVTMYAKCGSLNDAIWIFESSEDKNAITWSAMVTGLVQNGEPRTGLKLFSTMHFAGIKPTEFTLIGVIKACSENGSVEEGKQLHGYSIKFGFESLIYMAVALVDMYGNCVDITSARKVFDCSKASDDCVLWTSMIGAYASNGENESALSLFREMQAEPNELTAASALKACSSLAAMEQGRQIHGSAVKLGFSLSTPTGTALSTMYAKCGDLESAGSVFARLPERDSVSWNAMISGLSQNGRGHEALMLFDRMAASGTTNPDRTTLASVLSACSRIGSVERARWYFERMDRDFGMEPTVEHYACMVDVMGRAGRLREAKDFIESALKNTISRRDAPRLWRGLLGSCRSYADYELGAYAGERVVESGSWESSVYVQLAGIYACLGRRDDAERVRRMMEGRGIRKEAGWSWVELRSGAHAFVAGDELHPRIQDVRAEVERLTNHMSDQPDFTYEINFA